MDLSFNTRWLGQTLHHFPTLDSTNRRLTQLASENAPHGTVVIANAQTEGRGRLRRTWHSPANENLYLSVLLRPETLLVRHAATVSMATSLGVITGLGQCTALPLSVKWPNDLLCRGKKIAGILTELSTQGSTIDYLVIGIGINVCTEAFPTDLATKATSLAKEDPSENLKRDDILQAILPTLEQWLDLWIQMGPAPILEGWLKYAPWLDEPVNIATPNGKVEGIAKGIAPDGSLIIERMDGSRHHILVGDVELLGKINTHLI